jgi:hypothetical protein
VPVGHGGDADNQTLLAKDRGHEVLYLISVKRDLISVKRDLISVKRDLISVKREDQTLLAKDRVHEVLSNLNYYH